MQRVCFLLRIKPDRREEYLERHKDVWPEMLAALSDAGWHDYSLFLREDGLLVGYFLTEDLQACLDAMESTDVNRRWQAEMREFFVDRAGREADKQMKPLEQVFYLE